MSKIRNFILSFLFLLNNIFALTPCSENPNISYGFINTENDLLILNSINEQKELRIYKKNESFNIYQLNKTLNLIEKTSNESIYLDPNNSFSVYDKFRKEIIFFDYEFFLSYPININSFNPIKVEDITLIDNNRFIKSNTSLITIQIEINQFNYTNEPKYNTLAHFNLPINQYKYLKCISYNNNIICGYISYDSSSKTDFLYVFFIDSNYIKTEPIKIYEYNTSSVFAPVSERWLELIPMGDENLLFCLLNGDNQILCGLSHIGNYSNIKVSNKIEIIFSFPQEKLNFNIQLIFSKLILNDNELFLGYKKEDNIIQIKKIIINNNSLIQKEIAFISFDTKFINNFQMLKDNNNNLLLLLNHNNTLNKKVNEFLYFGYSTCKDINLELYNGEKTKISFTNMVPIFNLQQNLNDIVFIFEDKELISLITSEEEAILPNKTYDKENIYFKINPTTFDFIKNSSVYSIIYSNNMDEYSSQRCYLNLSFYKCKDKCDLCSKNGGCYDQYWNKVDEIDEIDDSDYPNIPDAPSTSSNKKKGYLIIIFIVFILIVILVICIICICSKIKKRNREMKNEYPQGNDFIQAQSPIVSDYNYSNFNNQYNNNQIKPIDGFTKGYEPINQINYNSSQDMGAPTPCYT